MVEANGGSRAHPSDTSFGTESLRLLSIFLWLGGIHVNVIVCLVAVFNLPSAWAITLLAFWAGMIFIPVKEDSRLGLAVGTFICRYGPSYFPMTVRIDEGARFDPAGSYVFGLEPHSVLPIGMMAVSKYMDALPVRGVRALASTVVFLVPGVRHVWSWLGLVPATKTIFRRVLEEGGSVVLVPGGVQECLYLRPGEEVVFLKQRLGFVKLALEAGAPLVPCFCFGQTQAFKWWKPSGALYRRFSRAIGFAPILFWGRLGSFVPFRSPMCMVIGKPVAVPKTDRPSPDQVADCHRQFVEAMEDLFERHKGAAGHAHLKLTIL